MVTRKEQMTMRSPRRNIPTAIALASALVLAGFAASASGGPPGTWTQITRAHNGAASNLGLARAKDGALHVLWAGPARTPFTAIFDTTISRSGAVGSPKAVVSGWSSVHPPAAVAAPDGKIHALVSGQKVNSNTDPFSGLNEAVGPGGWTLGSHAFGTYQITVPSNADVGVAMLKSGQLVSVWRTATTVLFQTGTDASTQPTNITPPGLAESPVIAVDSRSGEAVVAYRDSTSGTYFFRRVVPAVAAPVPMPQAKGLAPTIAARAGGGVFSAYTPDGARVWLLRYGAKPKNVPVPKGTRVLTAGVAAGPDGRLWVYYGNEQQTLVTRTSRAVSGFEPVQVLRSPPGTVQYFRLEGEGSGGPLDLFADVTVDGGAKDGSYHQQVWPELSLSARKSPSSVTVRVSDAGDPVAGARVTGLPGGAKTTGANGTVVVSSAQKGLWALTATKPGYVPARARVAP
jgi:hypothetical protein